MSCARSVLCIFLLAVLFLIPEFAEKFYVQFATKIIILAIFAMSLDLLVGHTGLTSLGHAAYFGLAGYVLAFSAPQYQAANFWTSLALTLGICALFALLVGLVVLRTSGVYFIMITLAFAQMLYFVIHDTKLAGGSDGLYIYIRPDATLGGWKPFDLENHTHFYYVSLIFLLATFFGLQRIISSLFGKVLAGIRANDRRMRSLGFATFRYKLVAFVISGTLGGLAGYLAAAQFGFVNPEMLAWHLSGSVLMMVILGGLGSPFGAMLGAVVMQLLELIFQGMPTIGGVNLGKHWQLFTGVTIVLVVLFIPHGIAGTANRLWDRKLK